MSAIAGTVGAIEAPQRVANMVELQQHRGGDGSSVTTFEAGAFGHAALHTTPQACTESQPIVHPPTGCVVSADIRLDNREELMTALGVREPDLGDAELALRAYLTWGRAFPRRLLGSFALAIWDPRVAQLTLVRDQLATRPIHYSATPRRVVFASTVEAVRNGSDSSHPASKEKLRQFLVEPLEAAELCRTVFDGIWAVPRASTLVWSAGTMPTIDRYWLLEQPPMLRLNDDREYVEAFAEVFTESIRCRLRAPGTIGATISGGLDSTAIVAAASEQLDAEALHTFGAVTVEPDSSSDAPFIESSVRHLGVGCSRISDLEIAKDYDLDFFLASPSSLFDVNMAVLNHVAGVMSKAGLKVLLTGIGPDTSLVTDRYSLVQALVASRRLSAAWLEATTYEGQRTSPTPLVKGFARRLLPEGFVTTVRKRRADRDFEDKLRDLGIDPNVDHLSHLRSVAHALEFEPEWTTQNARLNRLRHPFDACGLERYDRTAARHGVEVRNPFMDLRMLEFALSLPAEVVQRGGWQKWVLRAWLRSRLPDAVVDRPKSGSALSQFMRAVHQHHAFALEAPNHGVASVFDLGSPPIPRLPSFSLYVVNQWWAAYG